MFVYTRQFQNYDIWAFDWNNPQFADAGIGFRTIVAFCFEIFVLWPAFSAYFFTCSLRFFLWVQHFTKLKYWVQVVLFFPLWIVFEQVVGIRNQLTLAIRSLTSLGCIQGKVGGTLVDPTTGAVIPQQYVVMFNPLGGIIYLLGDNLKPQTYIAHVEASAWVDALLWIFLVIPLTIFCWILYEPVWSMKLRRRVWQRMFGKTKNDQSPRAC